MSRRIVVAVGLITVVTCSGAGVAWLFAAQESPAVIAFRQIEQGMTLQDLEAVMGSPTPTDTGSLLFGVGVNSDAGAPVSDASWWLPGGDVSIKLDRNGLVRDKWLVAHAGPSWFSRLRAWVRDALPQVQPASQQMDTLELNPPVPPPSLPPSSPSLPGPLSPGLLGTNRY